MDREVTDPIAHAYRQHFLERWRRYGESARTLWGGESSQEARFAVLAGLDDFSEKSVLDVGCGFGDFLGYLCKRGVAVAEYIGVEMVPELLSVARRRYPSGRFIETEVLSLAPGIRADLVVGSGLFFLPCQHWEDYVLAVVGRMFEMARIGMAVNFLSTISENQDGLSYYVDPAWVVTLMMKHVTHRIVLRHDYRANDFTVYLYKHNRDRGYPPT